MNVKINEREYIEFGLVTNINNIVKDNILIVENFLFKITLFITPKNIRTAALVADKGKFNKNKYAKIGSREIRLEIFSFTFTKVNNLVIIKKNNEI